MKKNKLKLAELKVTSFITKDTDLNAMTLKGGRKGNGTVIGIPTTKTKTDPTANTLCFVCPVDEIRF